MSIRNFAQVPPDLLVPGAAIPLPATDTHWPLTVCEFDKNYGPRRQEPVPRRFDSREVSYSDLARASSPKALLGTTQRNSCAAKMFFCLAEHSIEPSSDDSFAGNFPLAVQGAARLRHRNRWLISEASALGAACPFRGGKRVALFLAKREPLSSGWVHRCWFSADTAKVNRSCNGCGARTQGKPGCTIWFRPDCVLFAASPCATARCDLRVGQEIIRSQNDAKKYQCDS